MLRSYRVLIIEDDRTVRLLYERHLRAVVERGLVEVIYAGNSIDGKKQITSTEKSLDVIVFDSDIGETRLAHFLIVAGQIHHREAHLVATSSKPEHREMAIIIGCQHEANKEDVVKLVLGILKLLPE
jgi:response regulator of citrate/malate metabolism